MSALSSVLLLITAFFTATLSGIFGMAGGLVLMGALALLLPVSAAFVTHGILQMVSNGWRALLHRRYVVWRIVASYAAASVVAGAAILAIGLIPSRHVLFLLLGLVPMLVWLPKHWLQLDASKPIQAFLSGFLVTGLNLSAGVAGPLLDIFFVRTALTRHQIVATKAATQVFSHLLKILVYGVPLLLAVRHAGADDGAAPAAAGMPAWWVFAIAIPLSMLGTNLGGWVLDRMSDTNFKRWTAWIVTTIGLFYLYQAWTIWPR
jgi:uncharacterized membrane protein YfcA